MRAQAWKWEEEERVDISCHQILINFHLDAVWRIHFDYQVELLLWIILKLIIFLINYILSQKSSSHFVLYHGSKLQLDTLHCRFSWSESATCLSFVNLGAEFISRHQDKMFMFMEQQQKHLGKFTTQCICHFTWKLDARKLFFAMSQMREDCMNIIVVLHFTYSRGGKKH